LLAIILAIFAVFLIVEFLNSRQTTITRIPIIVAAFDIREGDKIQSVHLRSKHIDRRAYIDSMLTSGEENAYLGYSAAMDIGVGNPILKGALKLETSAREQFAPKITTGMRALSIPVGSISSVSQLVEPGDRVDILIHLEVMAPIENTADIRNLGMVPIMTEVKEPMSIYLLQDVKVMATGKILESTLKKSQNLDLGYATITIECTPDEAAVVAFAAFASNQTLGGAGAFTLLLRNPQDDGYLEKVTVTRFESLIDLANLESLFQRSRSRRIEIYGGGALKNS
jgi:pilus assembly protein CpaB